MPQPHPSTATRHAQTDAPRLTSVVRWLLALAVGTYFLQLTLVQPADLLTWLGFTPAEGRPWTVLTAPFVHVGFWHLVTTLVPLAVFGPAVEQAGPRRDFVLLLVLSAAGAAAAQTAFAPGDTMVGATAVVLGVLVAFAAWWPDEEVVLLGRFPVRAVWVEVAMAAAMLMEGMRSPQTGGTAALAHLGAIVTAWLWLRVVAFRAERRHSRMALAPDLPSDQPPRAIPRGGPRPPREPRSDADDAVAQSKALFGAVRRTATAPTAAEGREAGDTRATIDRLLDKIAAEGIDALTDAERRTLDEASRRLRRPSAD
jgi:membrane associated rhomboid family serine protease